MSDDRILANVLTLSDEAFAAHMREAQKQKMQMDALMRSVDATPANKEQL